MKRNAIGIGYVESLRQELEEFRKKVALLMVRLPSPYCDEINLALERNEQTINIIEKLIEDYGGEENFFSASQQR